MYVKQFIKSLPGCKQVIRYLSIEQRGLRRWRQEARQIIIQLKNGGRRVLYIGMCEDSNMGDMAQILCAERWIHTSFPECEIIRIHASTIMISEHRILETLKRYVNREDIFIFQCGYNTHDLGGYQDLVRQKIFVGFPDNEAIVLPQTVYFKSEENKRRCSEVYNSHKHLFFMVRDPVSMKMSKEMFPDIHIVMYPDIVAMLIGKYWHNGRREGICLCMRNDVERFYSMHQRQQISEILGHIDKVTLMDTVISKSYDKICKNIEKYVNRIIRFFAGKRLVVTDKYHGTIFALVANTPVIMLKTTDHKLTSIYEWFKGVFPDRIFFAESIDEIDDIAHHILKNPNYDQLPDYFDKMYYQNLYFEIQEWREKKGKCIYV